jgi:hypothetical protein
VFFFSHERSPRKNRSSTTQKPIHGAQETSDQKGGDDLARSMFTTEHRPGLPYMTK